MKLIKMCLVGSLLLITTVAYTQERKGKGKGKGSGGLRNAEVRGGYKAKFFTVPEEIAATFENLQPKALLYQPVKADREKLPLVISLHGSGGGRRDIESKGKWIGTIKELQKPENQKQQAMLLTPQSDGIWSPASLEKMLAWVLR